MGNKKPEYETLRNCTAMALIKAPKTVNLWYAARLIIENNKVVRMIHGDPEPMGHAVITLKQEIENEAELLTN